MTAATLDTWLTRLSRIESAIHECAESNALESEAASLDLQAEIDELRAAMHARWLQALRTEAI